MYVHELYRNLESYTSFYTSDRFYIGNILIIKEFSATLKYNIYKLYPYGFILSKNNTHKIKDKNHNFIRLNNELIKLIRQYKIGNILTNV